jgi:hypothetical protein
MDAFELEEPLSVHDLLLLNTSPIPCVVTKSEEHRFHVTQGYLKQTLNHVLKFNAFKSNPSSPV